MLWSVHDERVGDGEDRESWSMRVTVTTSPGTRLSSIRKKLAPVGPLASHVVALDVPAAASGLRQSAQAGFRALAHDSDASVTEAAILR
jgi:hypothetical protein